MIHKYGLRFSYKSYDVIFRLNYEYEVDSTFKETFDNACETFKGIDGVDEKRCLREQFDKIDLFSLVRDNYIDSIKPNETQQSDWTKNSRIFTDNLLKQSRKVMLQKFGIILKKINISGYEIVKREEDFND